MSSRDPFAIYTGSGDSLSHEGSGDVIDAVPPEQPLHDGDRLSGVAAEFPLRWLAIAAVAILSILWLRIGFLQLIEGDSYRAAAEGNRIHTEVTKALRGVMYGRNGDLLVKNVPDFRLQLTARDLPRHNDDLYADSLAMVLAHGHITEEERDELLQRSFATGQPITVRSFIPYEEALRIMSDVHGMQGVSVEPFYAREYLAGSPFSHVLGYSGKITEEEFVELSQNGYQLDDSVGKTGLELSYEDHLRGEDGYRNVEVNNRGLETAVVSDTAPVAGSNLYLTIDEELQRQLYEELGSVVESGDLSGATAVAMDPRDGSLRALVSYPTYDNNLFVGGISTDEYRSLIDDERNPLYHRAVTGTYPSGSTFKPIVATAALEEGVVTPATAVQSTGGLQIDRFFFPDWKAGGHGSTTVTKALAESVNTYFYLAGGGDNETTTGLGVERITEYARRFGLASHLGIDLPGESAGFLPSKAWKEEFKDEPWYIGDTYHLSIGQGDILVTPLQVASYTATIANGGTVYRPHVVERATNQAGDLVFEYEAEVLNEQVASSQSISVVQQGLRDAVLYGSARSMQVLPVSSAGKTGTAQFGDPDGKTHSWFTAYAPYDSTPELVLTVIVEEGGGGTDTALPVARRVMADYFSRKKAD